MKLSAILLAAVFAATAVTASDANAADLTWGGTYRAEANWIKNPELGGRESNKAYLLHHLILAPKLVAADGITIYSRLDVLNNSVFGGNNVAGDVLGNGPGAGQGADGTAGASTSTENSNPLSRNQEAGTVAVTALYLSWAQEFGQLVVGRTPIQFGLGTAFNAGTGLFDHYIDTKDMIGYKLVFGNLSVFPMIGKVDEGNLGAGDDVNDYLLHAQYDNPETELSMGAIYQMRTVGSGGNDLPQTGVIGGTPGAGIDAPLAAPTRTDNGKSSLIGVFLKRKISSFTFGIEGDFLSGDTGLVSSTGQDVEISGYGVAAEVAWAREGSKLSGNLKLGMASGDDPNTAKYEGFIFSRNYDVAMLMFNHPLGQRDILRTGVQQDLRNQAATNGQTDVRNTIDSEAVSNAIYLAPSLQYQWKDTVSVGGTFTYGMLNEEPIANGDTSKDLGFELDLNLTWKPYERLTWITQAGFLFPGSAWQGGSLGLDNDFTYGLVTKAAISF